MEIAKNTRATFVSTMIATVLIVVATVVFTTSADEGRNVDFQKRAEIHKEIKAAVENNDYDAWLAAISDTKMAEKNADNINEETFNKFVAAHNLFKAGDKEAAKEIMKDLGFKHKKGFGFGKHKRGKGSFGAMKNLTDEQKEAFKAAFESGDEDAIKALKEELGLKDHKAFGKNGGTHGKHSGKGNWSFDKGEYLAKFAEKLGMTEDGLQAALDSGKTIQEIAEEQGVELKHSGKRGSFGQWHKAKNEE